MAKTRTPRPASPLDALIDGASVEVLRDLVRSLTALDPDVRTVCLDTLSSQLPADAPQKADAAASAARSLWVKADVILDDLNAYGGGPDEDVEEACSLLDDLGQRVPSLRQEDRRELLDACLEYIESGNTGLDDPLDEFARACCTDDEDLRYLAERLEETGKESLEGDARRIYRQLGDRENYLRLRQRRMLYGSDYLDLVGFYLENGERQKAVEIARQGIEKAKGAMAELREFHAKELRRSGDRAGALDLEFANMLDNLSVESYKSFHKRCSPEEWERFEQRLLAALSGKRIETRINLHMFRGEYEAAVKLLADVQYDRWSHGSVVADAAKQLETRFPREVLSFYRTGLGRTDQTAPRGEYARWAQVAAKLRHMWVDIMQMPDEWHVFARKLKAQSLRRPAMQEEFGRVLGDWDSV